MWSYDLLTSLSELKTVSREIPCMTEKVTGYQRLLTGVATFTPEVVGEVREGTSVGRNQDPLPVSLGQ